MIAVMPTIRMILSSIGNAIPGQLQAGWRAAQTNNWAVRRLLLYLWAGLLRLAMFSLQGEFLPALLMEEDGCGLWDEAGNREGDFAFCKTISIFSILKILSAKIAGWSIRLPGQSNV